MFLDLHSPGGVGFGPARLSYQEIDAYARVTGRRIGRWESGLLVELSELYMITKAKKRPIKNDKGQQMQMIDMKDAGALRELLIGRSKPPAGAKQAPVGYKGPDMSE